MQSTNKILFSDSPCQCNVLRVAESALNDTFLIELVVRLKVLIFLFRHNDTHFVITGRLCLRSVQVLDQDMP